MIFRPQCQCRGGFAFLVINVTNSIGLYYALLLYCQQKSNWQQCPAFGWVDRCPRWKYTKTGSDFQQIHKILANFLIHLDECPEREYNKRVRFALA